MAALLEAGKCVLLPVNDDQRYDLVIDEEGKFFRIQCKSARLIRGAVVFATCSRNLATGRRHYRGEVEFFGVYCPSLGTCYLVPVEDAPDRACALRVAPCANNQSRKIRWAHRYLITHRIHEGAVAQAVERHAGSVEVVGSSPIGSTALQTCLEVGSGAGECRPN
jgi:hypothetical protein